MEVMLGVFSNALRDELLDRPPKPGRTQCTPRRDEESVVDTSRRVAEGLQRVVRKPGRDLPRHFKQKKHNRAACLVNIHKQCAAVLRLLRERVESCNRIRKMLEDAQAIDV